MLPQQLICIFLLMLSYLRETKIETKTDTPYRKFIYHLLAAVLPGDTFPSRNGTYSNTPFGCGPENISIFQMMFSTPRGLFQKSKENGKVMDRKERRLGICRRLYATFLILISTQNETKNKSTFRLAFLPYFFLHFFGFFLSKLSARLDVEFFGFDFFFCVYFFFLLNFVLGPLFQ